MKERLSCLIVGLLCSLAASAQDLPINRDTKLVSVSNVIIVDTASKEQLSQRLEEWINLNSSASQALLNVERTTKKRKKDKEHTIPAFFAEKKLSTEDKTFYTVSIGSAFKSNRIGEGLSNSKTYSPSPISHTQCTLIVLFKDGKMKYEFTNFAHVNLNTDKSGGKYENDRPDAFKREMNRKEWTALRLQTIEKVKRIAGSLEEYIIHPLNTEMNF